MITPSSRPRGRRGVLGSPVNLSVFALACLVVVAATAGGIRALAGSAQSVLPGASFNVHRAIVRTIDPGARSQGLRLGDRISAVAGVPTPDGESVDRVLREVGAGRRVVLMLDSGQGVHVETRRPHLGPALARLVCGVLFMLVGLAVFVLGADRESAGAFLLGGVALGVSMVGAVGEPLVTQPLISVQASLVGLALSGPALVHFFAVFPNRLPVATTRRWILPAVDASFGALGVVLAWSYGATPEGLTRALAVVATVCNAVSVVAVVAILVWRLRRSHPPQLQAKLRLLIAAAVVSFPLIAAVTILRVAEVYSPSPTLEVVAVVALMAFPIMVAMAIVRLDLLSLDRAMARSSAFAATLTVVGGAYIAAGLALPHVLAPRMIAASPVALSVLIAALLVALVPLRRTIEARLEHVFFKRDIEADISAAQAMIARLDQGTKPEVYGRLERFLEEVIGDGRVGIYLRAGSGRWQRPSTGGAREDLDGRVIPIALGDDDFGAVSIANAGDLSGTLTELVGDVAALLARVVGRPESRRQLGNYQIERLLGAGGMGCVYLAYRVGAAGFRKSVALKQLLPSAALDPKTTELFIHEARVVAELNHPNIVQTFELGQQGDGYFIAMEYVDGLDVHRLLEAMRQADEHLAVSIAVAVASSVCAALDFAHRAVDPAGNDVGIVHYDVSPHNVLISRRGVVKLADFGIARLVEDRRWEGLLVGKYSYMAPEQLRGDPLDHRVDIFAAGIVLYELVAGVHPFYQRGSRERTWQSIETGRFLPADSLRSGCSRRLARVIERALAVRPRDRFQSAGAMADELDAIAPRTARTAEELGRLVERYLGAGVGAATSAPTTQTALDRPDRA